VCHVRMLKEAELSRVFEADLPGIHFSMNSVSLYTFHQELIMRGDEPMSPSGWCVAHRPLVLVARRCITCMSMLMTRS
jgi:hypothetical protein